MKKVLIADDHEVVRTGLKALLADEPDLTLVGEAWDGLEVTPLVEKLRPDVLVLDLQLPNLRGIEIVRQVARRVPGTRIVFLSIYANEAYVVEALRAGASAYILKDAGNDELVKGIREAMAGRRYLSPPLTERAIQLYLERVAETPDAYETLTEREREVLFLSAEGKTLQEIADRLFISCRTVETHRARVMRKLGLRNHAELIRYAYERGLMPTPKPEG